MMLLKYGKGGTTIYSLNLHRNPLGIKGCEILKEFLLPLRNSCMIELNLTRCGIDAQAFAELMKGMNKNKCMSKLILRSNPITGAAGPLLAKFIMLNNSLSHLDLSHTDFNSAAVCMLVASLQQIKFLNGPNRKLQVLDLSENDICDVGAKAMSQLLQADYIRLLHLDLQGNRLTSTGIVFALKLLS